MRLLRLEPWGEQSAGHNIGKQFTGIVFFLHCSDFPVLIFSDSASVELVPEHALATICGGPGCSMHKPCIETAWVSLVQTVFTRALIKLLGVPMQPPSSTDQLPGQFLLLASQR